MKNYVSEGDCLELTAPVGGVVSGETVAIGSLIVVSQDTKDAGETFIGCIGGIYTLPILAGDVPTVGAKAYWDSGAGTWTVTAGMGPLPLGGHFVSTEIGTSNTANIKLLEY